jgi:ketosteroid isomerase-like protein
MFYGVDPAGKAINPRAMARPLSAFLALLLMAATAARAEEAAVPDDVAIRQLNDDYVRAFLACDVAKFRGMMTEDFVGVLADGRVIDKAEFLREAASPPNARDLRLHEVTIREYGDSAIIGALVTYHRADGTGVRTRYTSFLVHSGGAWMISWVQWTRVVAP